MEENDLTDIEIDRKKFTLRHLSSCSRLRKMLQDCFLDFSI